MERLGIYIFVFFFLGLTFFERVRTMGETGSLWRVLLRNLAVSLLAALGFFFIGTDIAFPEFERKLFGTAMSIINYTPPYGEVNPEHRFTLFMDTWLQCLFCAAATMIVAAGTWELKVRAWQKWVIAAVFGLLVYPLFGYFQGEDGFLGKRGFYDYAGALFIWALPAAFVLGNRIVISSKWLPGEKKHDLSDHKILPGIKHRFLFSRGIGFTMIFLVLNETTLVDHSWFVSKTLTLLPASLTVLFCQLLFFGLFGRNKPDRFAYAPPILGVMGALVATQACNQYDSEDAIIASVVTTFLISLYLRLAPLKIRIWDPVCSVPIFLLGGILGILMATITDSAAIGSQIFGVLTCLLWGTGTGALLSLLLRTFRKEPVNIVLRKEEDGTTPSTTEGPGD